MTREPVAIIFPRPHLWVLVIGNHYIWYRRSTVMSHQGRAPLLLHRSATCPGRGEVSLPGDWTAPPPLSSSFSSASPSSSSPSSSVFSAWPSSSWLCFSWIYSSSSWTFHRWRTTTRTKTRTKKNFFGAPSSLLFWYLKDKECVEPQLNSPICPFHCFKPTLGFFARRFLWRFASTPAAWGGRRRRWRWRRRGGPSPFLHFLLFLLSAPPVTRPAAVHCSGSETWVNARLVKN